MARKISLTIPLEANPLPYQNQVRSKIQHNRDGKSYVKHYKTSKLNSYQTYIRLMARSAANRVGWEIIEKYFKIELHMVFKNRTHGDADNCEKSIMDALEGELFKNDKWAKDKHVHYSYGSEAKIIVKVEELVL